MKRNQVIQWRRAVGRIKKKAEQYEILIAIPDALRIFTKASMSNKERNQGGCINYP
jgi:hypothetical protein